MKVFHRNELMKHNLPGRVIQRAVGKDSESVSKKMTTCFAHYSAASGHVEPHHHAEEVVYIISTRPSSFQHTSPNCASTNKKAEYLCMNTRPLH